MIRLSTSRIVLKATLDDILSEDDDLLDIAPIKKKSAPVDLVSSQFAELEAFYEQHGRLPAMTSGAQMKEKLLAKRLASIMAIPSLVESLRAKDRLGILEMGALPLVAAGEPPIYIDKSELVQSLDDIFNDDDDDLLSFDTPDIFNIKHVQIEKKELPDEIAQRQPCPDFPRFEPLFATVHKQIKAGEFSTIRFRHELKIIEGDFFILNGVMGYVHKAGERLEQYSSYNARLHIVFENGTEMNMLYQSLTHGLVRDTEGRKILLSGAKLIPSDIQIPSGLIYVLATKSTNPALNPYLHNLYKIGFTETSIEQRIKNAEKDRTFLEAPVRIVATTECFNLNAQKLEALVHGFLAARRLNVTLKSENGQIYTPREWFNVPLSTVQAVIQHIVDGTISKYRLDSTSGRVLPK
ncbi:GIY-YIG nuclease family protein [Alishewanella sp. 16-MA]|uniref:GIY-YIG nuclease family protein n=1 Tax=Alishewanella maricola TaxID=2795740 RepID=A0ABS8C7S9_9ALTE|nr:GIY-YIG nuclease family protein [Alishewanella maricola]MCB5228356.1 GIY-YIG nuclease family protein [Alishewanella maricola]